MKVSKWMKDAGVFPEGGEGFVDSLVGLFNDNEKLIERAGMGITFKNGAKMIIRMSTKVAEEATKE